MIRASARTPGAHADAPSIQKLFTRLVRWMRPHPGRAAFVAVALLVEAAFAAAVPLLFQAVIDRAIVPRDTQALAILLATLGGGAIVVAAVGVWGDLVYARLASAILADVRASMLAKVTRLARGQFSRIPVSNVLLRFSADVTAVGTAVGSILSWAVLPTLDVILGTALMFAIDWRLALLALLVGPVALLGPRVYAPRAAAAALEAREAESAAQATVEEACRGHDVVRAYGLERGVLARFGERVSRLGERTVRTQFLGSMADRTSKGGVQLLRVALLTWGATLAVRGELSVGSLVAVHTLFCSVADALGYLAQYVPTLSQGAAGCDRIDGLLALAEAPPDAPDAVDLPAIEREIRVEGVCVDGADGRRVLDGVDLSIARGSRVALVGPSGSGKSTLLGVIASVFHPAGGRVLVDGRDLRSVRRASYLRRLAIVSQESFLFEGTLRDNVRLGDPGADDAAIEAAVRAVGLDGALLGHTLGLDSPVGEGGSQLSGGQRQRVALARALLRAPDVLLLDEATSALDAVTEASVLAAIERASAGRTVVSVTHNLAGITSYDRIVVLTDGRIVEQGTHESLLMAGGAYARLWEKRRAVHVDAAGARVVAANLARMPLFESVDDAVLDRLAAEFEPVEVPAGRTLFRKGDAGDAFYVVARGSVEVWAGRDPPSVPVRRGDELQPDLVLDDGEFFGESALLHAEPRNATVRARRPALLLALRRGPFERLLEREPQVRVRLERDTDERAASATPAAARDRDE